MVLFGKKQIVRRFGKTNITDGYRDTDYEDMTLVLDVQMPVKPSRFEEAGKASLAKLQVFSDAELLPPDRGVSGHPDWLWYLGKWYECTSCVICPNTILKHYESEFTELPDQEGAP